MKYYTYIIYSKEYDKYYKGYTSQLLQRLEQHNNKESRYTSKFAPWKLVYFEEFENKTEAIKRERSLKKYSKEQLITLINSAKNKLRG